MHSHVETDYQLQTDLSMNGKEVWLKTGYHLVMDTDYYIFLNNDNYWTITSNGINLSDSDDIVAQCAVQSLSNPYDCSVWNTIASNGDLTLSLNLKMNNSLCDITDNYICLESTQSTLGMLTCLLAHLTAHALKCT